MLLRIPQPPRPPNSPTSSLILAADWADGRITAGSQSGAVKTTANCPKSRQRPLQQARHIVPAALACHPMFVTGARKRTKTPTTSLSR
jgi:PKHD-type hydroxylase